MLRSSGDETPRMPEVTAIWAMILCGRRGPLWIVGVRRTSCPSVGKEGYSMLNYILSTSFRLLTIGDLIRTLR
jgi:hypothetical protein